MRSRTFAAVRVGVSLAIVAGLIYKLSPSELADRIRGSNLLLLLAALALMLLSQLLVIVKWALLLRARDVRAPAPLIVRTYCIGNLLSNLLPGAISGDVYRVYCVHRDAEARTIDVTMSVLYERATGDAAMTCLGGLGVRESTYSGLLHKAGASAAQGASTGFALGLLLIAANALILLALEVAERLGYADRAPVIEIAQPAKT